jgi:hypothetical protein
MHVGLVFFLTNEAFYVYLGVIGRVVVTFLLY